jgi:hypothetical protein
MSGLDSGDTEGQMTEDEIRAVARTARSLLSTIVPAVDVARIDAELARALALPRGRARWALLEVLRGHPDLRRWVGDDVLVRCSAPATDGGSPRKRSPRKRSPSKGSPQVTRHLLAEIPDQVAIGSRFSVVVSVGVEGAAGLPDSIFQLDIPKEGVTLTIVVSANDFVVDGDRALDLHVPQKADSSRVAFTLLAPRPGRFPLHVRAFRAGTEVVELSTEVAVGTAATQQYSPHRSVVIDDLEAEAGEVTLMVEETPDKQYRFRFLSDEPDPLEVSERLMGRPEKVVQNLVEELSRLAAHKSEYKGEAQTVRLRNLGISLWRSVPALVAARFWEQRDRNLISAFTVLSNSDAVPWELMYPLNDGHDERFLVEQVPVLRRVDGQSRVRHLGLARAAFVVPPRSPTHARHEVAKVRARLGKQVSVGDKDIDGYVQLNELMNAPPSLLHFSCHNLYSEETGSRISLRDGSFRPDDLDRAVLLRTFETGSPLVFLNACRTAGEVKGLTRPTSWARQFMAAGAGAFVGSLWDVRSAAAADFADSFYDGLITKRLRLGDAALQARRAAAAATRDGDPTWLAYTVYGSPTARIRKASSGA